MERGNDKVKYKLTEKDLKIDLSKYSLFKKLLFKIITWVVKK